MLHEAYALSKEKSARRAAVEPDISQSNIHQMLCTDIKASLQNLQTEHKLEEENDDCWVETSEILSNHYESNSFILDKICFKYKAVFHLPCKANQHDT